MDIALAALSGVYDQIEFKSAVSPPTSFNVRDLQSSSPPSPLTQWLQPTLILTGPQGRYVIAPYGEAQGGYAPLIGTVAAIFGIGFLLGRFVR